MVHFQNTQKISWEKLKIH